MPKIDCFDILKNDTELLDKFSSILDTMEESEQRELSINIANKLISELTVEANKMRGKMNLPQIKLVNKDNRREIDKIKKEYEAKIDSIQKQQAQPTQDVEPQLKNQDNGKQPILFAEDENEQKLIEAKLAKQDNPIAKPIIEVIEGKAESDDKVKLNEVVKAVDEMVEIATDVVNAPISEIKINEKEYQGRKNKFSERSANNVHQNFDRNKFDPIIIYKHPDGNTYVLSGHSRLEGMKRRKEATIPARYFEGTPQEAKDFALKSNKLGTLQTDLENADYYRKKREAGESHNAILSEAKKNEQEGSAVRIIDYSYLNPKGKAYQALEALEKGESDSTDNVKMISQKAGRLRSLNPHLTDAHENELFDYFSKEGYPTDKEIQDQNSTINRSINAAKFDTTEPLNLNKFSLKSPQRIEWENERDTFIKDIADLKKEVNPSKITGWSGLKERAIAVLSQGKSKDAIEQAEKDFNNDKNGVKTAYEKQLETKKQILKVLQDKLAKHLLREKSLIEGDKAQGALFMATTDPVTIAEQQLTAAKKELDKKRREFYGEVMNGVDDLFGSNVKPNLFGDNLPAVDLKDAQKALEPYKDKVEAARKNLEKVKRDAATQQTLFSKTPFKKVISKEAFNKLIDRLKKAFPNTNVFTDKNLLKQKLAEYGYDVTQFLKTPKGVIYGAAFPDGSVYVNPDFLNANAPIHEYSHIFEKLNPTAWAKGVAVIKDTKAGKELFASLRANDAYANKTDEQIWSEALNTFIGNKGEDIHQQSSLARFKEWLKYFFNGIANKLGIKLSPDTSLEIFARDVVGKLLGGKEIANEIKQINEGEVELSAAKQQIDKTSKSLSNKDVSEAILNMAKNNLDALENVLFNSPIEGEVRHDKNYNEVKLIGYVGRDRKYSTGKEGGKHNISKKEFINWLLSDSPFNENEHTVDEEWMNNINALRAEINSSPKKYLNKTEDGTPYVSESTGDYAQGNLFESNKETDKEFLNVQAVWRKEKNVNMTGTTTVKNAADVAEIFKFLENKSVENFYAVYVDAKGKSHIQHISVGGITDTVVDMRLLLNGVEKFGAKKMYLIHNHPSGNMIPSEPDKRITRAARMYLDTMGIQMEHVIMDTYKKEYLTIDQNDEIYLSTRDEKTDSVKLSYHVMDEQKILSEPIHKVTSSRDAVNFIQQLRFTAMPKTAMLLLNQNNAIIGNYILSEDATTKEVLSFIGKATTGVNVIFYGNNNLRSSEINKIGDTLAAADIKIFDIIQMSSNNEDIQGYYKSRADGDLITEHQQTYGTTLQELENNYQSQIKKIKDYASEIITGRKEISRYDRQVEQGRIEGGSRNVEATSILTGSGKGLGQIKGRARQEQAIEKYAKEEGIWLGDNIEVEPEVGTIEKGIGKFKISGTEAQVYVNQNKPNILRKVITVTNPMDSVRGIDDNSILDFLDKRISLHNSIAKSVPYKLIGWGKNENGNFVAIVEQPYIQNARPATNKEIDEFYISQGWKAEGKYTYENENYTSTDIKPDNILVDEQGNLHLIDTQLDVKYEINEEPDVEFMASTEELQNEFPELDEKRIEQVKSAFSSGQTRDEIVNRTNQFVKNDLMDKEEADQIVALFDKLSEQPKHTDRVAGFRVKPKPQAPEITETNPKGDMFPNEKTEEDTTGIAHRHTEIIRESLGLPEYDRTPRTESELNTEAELQIKNGYNIADLIVRWEQGKFSKDIALEQKIMEKYISAMEAKDNLTNEEISMYRRAIKASDTIGSILGLGLWARVGNVLKDDSLASFFVAEMEASKTDELTDTQKAIVEEEYNAIKDANKKLEDKISELETELARKQANKNLKTNPPSQKKDHDTYVKEREDIKKSIQDKLKESRSNFSSTIVPYANELIAIAPDVTKLVKSYLSEGISKLDDIVDEIYSIIKDSSSNITKNDIIDIIAGKYDEAKKTKNNLKSELNELKTQSRLVSRLNDLENGIEPSSDIQKKKKNQEVADLRKKINSNYLQQLADTKKRMKAQIEKIEDDLISGNYAKPETKEELLLDQEAIILKDELIRVKRERAIRLMKEKYANRTKTQKAGDATLELLNVPRTIMSSMDFSAPLRQGLVASVAHPSIALKAFAEMFKQAVSQKRFDRWFYEARESDEYKIMELSGLFIADPHDYKLSAKEEAFMNNYAEKIPLIGKLIKGSERAYVSYLNKMRYDLFLQGAEVLESQGITYENSPKDYEALAGFINSSTGRGKLATVAGVDLEKAAPIFNSIFFSPRLIASRLSLLNPLYYAKLPKAVRIMALKDMAKFVLFGTSMLALLKLSFGCPDGCKDCEGCVDVEIDPRSTDFGKLKIGNTRYDVWGGFQQYARIIAQLAAGATKSTTTGRIRSLDGKGIFGRDRADQATTFFRGKLAPIPSTILDFAAGRNIVGEPVTTSSILKRNLLPLIYSDVETAYQEQGAKALLTVGLPASFGIGVSTYDNNKNKKK